MEPVFFTDQTKFRKWLELNHKQETELLVGYYKVKTGKPSMTWPESVNQAICFGWIDGIRKSINEESYCIRFTPRRNTSTWSAVNIEKVKKLSKQGLMKPAGLKAFANRKEEKSKIYSYENENKALRLDFEKKFKANKTAWKFFTAQAPYYQKITTIWIMSAKQEKTRLSRLEKAITSSKDQKRLW